MNEGLYGQSYGAPLKASRVRYLVGQGSQRYLGEAVVLGTCDDMTGQTTRYKGGSASTTDRTDLVLQVPVTRGRVGGQLQGGALMVQLPDGTIVGGNQRGYSAVDWQTMRGQAIHVASGDWSVVGGGQNNLARASGAVVGGGIGNSANNIYSFVGGGNGNAAQGGWAVVAGGQNNQSNGSTAFIGSGSGNSVQGSVADFSAIGGGLNNDCRAPCSGVLSGNRATTRTYGAQAQAAGIFSTNGDAQVQTHVLRRQLVGAVSAQTLYADGASSVLINVVSAPVNLPYLPNDTTYLFEAQIVARRTDVDGESAAWIIRGVIDRGTSAATTRLIGTPTVTEVARDIALNASVQAVADTANGAIAIQASVTDVGKTVRFVARVQTVEVAG